MYSYSQNNPDWKNISLGFSPLTIGNDGCTITSFANWHNKVFDTDYTPLQVNDRLKAVRAFSGAKIIWGMIPLAFPKCKFTFRGVQYNNIMVAGYVYGKGLPVMVEVQPVSSMPSFHHWVLFIGNRLMIDPFDGKLKSTSTYPCTGYALLDRA